MTQSTFALLTTTGRAKEALALASGEPLVISAIAIGDGTTVPSGGEKKLYHEIARKTVSGHGLVAGTTNTAYFDIHLAATDGPYTIREAGLYDAAGDLVAIACYDPPINKPTPESGQTVEGDVRLQIAFANAENVIVQVDASSQVPLQRLTVKPWVPIKSIDTKQPPENPVPGDVYVIPATSSGVWKGQSQKLAEFTPAGWAITDTPDGHGVGLPDGSIFIKIAGVYVPLTDLFDKRYSRLVTPPSSTFYVIGPAGNDKNTGLAPTPKEGFATIQGAIDAISHKYITQSTITLMISPGTYDGVAIDASFVSQWKLVGDRENPGAVRVIATDPKKPIIRGLTVGNATNVAVYGMTFSGYCEAIATTGGSVIVWDCNVVLGVVTQSSGFACYGGSIAIYGNIKVSGAGLSVFRASSGKMQVGYFDIQTTYPAVITYNNATVATGNFEISQGGQLSIDARVVKFEGIPYGPAYNVSFNSTITTVGGGAAFIPGTKPGSVSTSSYIN